jgi:5'-deoxy-5'-methylthioadenosine phosphorylase
MPALAIIGGTGLANLEGLENIHKAVVKTPYGEPSSPLTFGTLDGVDIVFMARHGYGHTIPPHKVNYRANIWALQQTGARFLLAIAAVGSLNEMMKPSGLVLPDQIIDYSWGRHSTFYEDDLDKVTHIDFTYPYSQSLRDLVNQSAAIAKLELVEQAVYGCTQGPRLETAAEIQKLKRDGCDLVGMTGMPEAALARELKLDYACCAVVVNWAAGLSEGEISMQDIERHVNTGVHKINKLLLSLVKQIQV